MHENCNIMRDLMPLCIDGAASDDSHRAVSRHIADCDECLKYYREMQTDMTRALAARPTEDEVKKAMKLVARKRRRRILLIVLASVAGLFLLWALLYWLNNAPVLVDNDDYAIELYTTDTGVLMRYKNLDNRWQTHNMRFDHSSRTLHIIGETVRLPLSWGPLEENIAVVNLSWYDDETGFMWREGRNSYTVAEIRRGRSDQPEEILWQQGDPKPPEVPNALRDAYGVMPFATPMPTMTVSPTDIAPTLEPRLTAAPEGFATLAPRLTPAP